MVTFILFQAGEGRDLRPTVYKFFLNACGFHILWQ
jgi:hypothetical protein